MTALGRPRRLLALISALAGLAGCTLPGSEGGTSARTPAKPATGQFDGTYAGTLAPTANNDPVCGIGSTPIRFRIFGETIREGHKHSRRRLDGTVTADGSFTLRDQDNERVITGTIAGNTLSATQSAIRHSADTLRATITCNASVTATRDATAGAAD